MRDIKEVISCKTDKLRDVVSNFNILDLTVDEKK